MFQLLRHITFIRYLSFSINIWEFRAKPFNLLFLFHYPRTGLSCISYFFLLFFPFNQSLSLSRIADTLNECFRPLGYWWQLWNLKLNDCSFLIKSFHQRLTCWEDYWKIACTLNFSILNTLFPVVKLTIAL